MTETREKGEDVAWVTLAAESADFENLYARYITTPNALPDYNAGCSDSFL